MRAGAALERLGAGHLLARSHRGLPWCTTVAAISPCCHLALPPHPLSFEAREFQLSPAPVASSRPASSSRRSSLVTRRCRTSWRAASAAASSASRARRIS